MAAARAKDEGCITPPVDEQDDRVPTNDPFPDLLFQNAG
jgi:hypothetical protein